MSSKQHDIKLFKLVSIKQFTRREMLQALGIIIAGLVIGCSGDAVEADPHAVEADMPDAVEADMPDAVEADTPDALDADMPNAATDAEFVDDGDLSPDADVVDNADSDSELGSDADFESDADTDEDEGPPLIGPLFALHLTDIHIGAQDMSGPALEKMLIEGVAGINPAITVVTGDLVDKGHEEALWTEYEAIAAAARAEEYLEVPGNHDARFDSELSHYLRHSVTGAHTESTFSYRVVEAAGRRVRFVGVNTASAGDVVRNLTGYLDGSQVDELIASIDALAEPVDSTVIVGHHPLNGVNGLALYGTDDNLSRLIEATAASVYLFGHVHLYDEWWDSDVLHVQGPTLGNPSFISDAGFCILGIDDDGPVVRRINIDFDGTRIDTPWPLVLITRPSDAEIGSGNPHSPVLPRSTPGQLLRAGVFSATLIYEVNWRVDGGPWSPMTPVESWYEAEFETSDASSMTIEVNATADGGGSDTHRITVNLE